MLVVDFFIFFHIGFEGFQLFAVEVAHDVHGVDMVEVGGELHLQGQEAGSGVFAFFGDGADKDATRENVGVAAGEHRVTLIDIEVFGNVLKIDRLRVAVPPGDGS